MKIYSKTFVNIYIFLNLTDFIIYRILQNLLINILVCLII